MFGGSFCLAENSSKSNQYISCPHCAENTLSSADIGCTCRDQETFIFTMVLYCVVLGDVHAAFPYDSIMGQNRANGGDRLHNREFVLYEKGQAYPEYVIDFRRSASNERSPADINRLQEKCRHFLINTFRCVLE